MVNQSNRDPLKPRLPVVIDEEQINRAKAIWTQSPSDVSDEDYVDLYKHVSMDWQEPMTKLHIRAEGTLQFNAILFIPANRPWQLDRLDFKVGVQLFQKGVKVLDHADTIVPRFLDTIDHGMVKCFIVLRSTIPW